jgi:hypothetical protein
VRIVPSAILTLALAACEWPAGVNCTSEARPSIRLTLVDSTTGAPIIGDYTVMITDGDYVESLNLSNPPVEPTGVFLGEERSGIYRVKAKATGYQSWQREGVRITEDRCHVRTVEVEARMQAEETPVSANAASW